MEAPFKNRVANTDAFVADEATWKHVFRGCNQDFNVVL
jgi:hypothetical protein